MTYIKNRQMTPVIENSCPEYKCHCRSASSLLPMVWILVVAPRPTLSVMLVEQGYTMSIYDIFYYDDKAMFDCHYDYITATEMAEHLFNLGKVLQQLWTLLEVDGILALMTKQVIDKTAFANWHYKNEPTHICFSPAPLLNG